MRMAGDQKSKTVTFSILKMQELQTKQALTEVYAALVEKGYNPINQIVGYILSEDPTYITNHKNARAIISRLDRDELLKILVASYLGTDTERNEDNE